MRAQATPAGFDAQTALCTDDVGGLRAHADPAWSGFAGAHGGWLAAVALRAAVHVAGDAARAPRSLAIQLAAPAQAGPVGLRARLDRAGRTLSHVTLRAEQDGATVATAAAILGRAGGSVVHAAATMPDVPPPGGCPPLLEKPVAGAGAGLLVEHRPAAGPLPLAGDARAELVVWMRLAEGRPVDAVLATVLADAAAPALYAHLTEPLFMPSVELAFQYAPALAEPQGEWVLGVFRNVAAADGYAWEDGELWSEDGTLLVRARQLRRVAGRRARGESSREG